MEGLAAARAGEREDALHDVVADGAPAVARAALVLLLLVRLEPAPRRSSSSARPALSGLSCRPVSKPMLHGSSTARNTARGTPQSSAA